MNYSTFTKDFLKKQNIDFFSLRGRETKFSPVLSSPKCPQWYLKPRADNPTQVFPRGGNDPIAVSSECTSAGSWARRGGAGM